MKSRLGFLLAIPLLFGTATTARAQSAADLLKTYDKTTLSGRLDSVVSLYPSTGKPGTNGKPVRYPAQILFERPDRFRFVLRPGQNDELRTVSEAGVLRWLDLATGFSGKEATEAIVDPIAVALLGSAGQLSRYYGLKEQAVAKDSPMIGVRLIPNGMTSVQTGHVWLSREGAPAGFDFHLSDGTRVFVAVMRFEKNVKTSPEDFQL